MNHHFSFKSWNNPLSFNVNINFEWNWTVHFDFSVEWRHVMSLTYISVLPVHVERWKICMNRSSGATVRWQGRDTLSRWTWRTCWWCRHSYRLWFSNCRGCSGWVGTVHRRRTRGPWHGIPPATWQGWKARPRFRKNECCKSHIRNVFR